MDPKENNLSTRLVAHRLFEAFRSIAPLKRRPGFGHAGRPGEFHLIHRLSHEDPDTGIRIGDLATCLGVKPPTVSQMVDALVSRGLVERYNDQSDRRVIRVRLSPSGRSMAESFHKQALDEAMALVDYLGAKDGAQLASLLSKASEFFLSRHGSDCPEHGCGNAMKE